MGSVSNSISASNPDINRPPPDGTSLSLFAVTTYHLKPGQEQAFNETLARFHEVVVEGDYPIYYTTGTPVLGTGGPQAQFVNFSPDWAGFGSGGPPLIEFLIEAMGEGDFEELYQDFSATFTSLESVVVRIRPDLSISAAN